MNDQKLLELSARAAGYPDYFEGMIVSSPEDSFHVWNPLTDDGDALRLAVNLNLELVITDHGCGAHHGEIFRLVALNEVADIYAATRRAIVRAAAEMGREISD